MTPIQDLVDKLEALIAQAQPIAGVITQAESLVAELKKQIAPPALRTDRDVVPLPPLPVFGPKGTTITDPTFGQPITRVTDETTRHGVHIATPSAPNLSAWSSNGSQFYGFGADGSVLVFPFANGAAGTPVEQIDPQGRGFIAEPCFARVASKPTTLYAPHYSYTVVAWDTATKTRKVLFDVQQDTGPLSQTPSTAYPGGSYMSAVYASQGTPERLAWSGGDTQERHRFVGAFDVDNPANRVTLNVKTSQMKVNGGAWEPILRPDGTPANIAWGLHAIAFDRSGKWVRLYLSGDFGGPYHTAFFNVQTQRLHEWTSNAYGGHDSMGFESNICCIADPHGGAVFQWLYHDLTQPGFPPPWRPLVVPAPNANSQQHADHSSWNNATPTGYAPLVSGCMAANAAPERIAYDGEIVLVSTDPAVHQVQRVCHHRMSAPTNYFYDSPRVQVSPDGQWTLFNSNWDNTWGRRDLCVVKNTR